MAQLNDLIVNGYTRFLNSAYGNLNGSATSALCAAYAAAAGSAPVASHSITSTAHSDTGTFFSGNSARSACSATSAKNAGTASDSNKLGGITATSYAQINSSYANLSAGSAAKAAELTNKDILVSAAKKVVNTTATANSWFDVPLISASAIYVDSDTKLKYNPNSNVLSSTNIYGATVSATTSKATYFSGTTLSGASTSMAINDLINSAKRTIGAGVLTITTGDTTATGTFGANQTGNTSITLGSMALKKAGEYSLSSHNHYLSALDGTGTYFSGTTVAPSALSALTSKSALSAGSATKAAQDGAGNTITTTYGKKVNDVFYVVGSYNTTTYPTYTNTNTYAKSAYAVYNGRIYSATENVPTATGWSAVSSKFSTANIAVPLLGNTTATADASSLTAGLKISYLMPLMGGTSTTLNLNSLGAKTIRVNNSNMTTHYPSGTIVNLTYDGTYWKCADWADGNTDTKVTQNSATDNSALPLILKRTATGNESNTVKYSTGATYNPYTRVFKIVDGNGEESVSITPTHLSCTYGEMSFPCSVNVSDLIEVTSYFSNGSAKSALTSKSALSAGTAGSSKWTSGSDNILRPISFANSNASAAWNGNSEFNSDQVYSKYFLFNPTNNVLQVGNLTTDRNNQGGIYTNYVNSLYIEAGQINGTQVYFSDDKNYVGSEIVQIGGSVVKATSSEFVYKPQLRLDWGSATVQDSTYSSTAPKILFIGGNSNTSYNCSAALTFSYYDTPMRFGSTANHKSLAGGWFDFTVKDTGSQNAGVLADCFSATSGYFSNNYVNDVHVLSSLHISADELWVPDTFYMYASPNTEDGRFILSGKLIADRVSAEIINTPTANINSGSFMWSSATTAKAELFEGATGKFTNISATDITAANQLTASTAYIKTLSGVSAKYTNISATCISAGNLTRLYACGGIADNWTAPTTATLGPMNQFRDKTSNIVYIMPTGSQGTNTYLTVNISSLNINDGDHNGVFEVHYYSPYAYPNGNDPLRITVGNFPDGVATSAYIYYDKGNVTATSSQRFYSSTYVKTNGTTGFDLYLGFSGAQGVPTSSVVSRNHIAQFYYSSGQHRLFIHCYG